MKIFRKMKIFKNMFGKEFDIKNMIQELPAHPDRTWSKRKLSRINKIIVHQELGDATIEQVNRYHITPSSNNHISPDGAPKFAYHFGITKKGEVWQTNILSDVTWHCRGQNSVSIGIMVVGDFHAPNHTGTKQGPLKKQLDALEYLLNYLVERSKLNLDSGCVYGHSNFGKLTCPGSALENFITNYRRKGRE